MSDRVRFAKKRRTPATYTAIREPSRHGLRSFGGVRRALRKRRATDCDLNRPVSPELSESLACDARPCERLEPVGRFRRSLRRARTSPFRVHVGVSCVQPATALSGYRDRAARRSVAGSPTEASSRDAVAWPVSPSPSSEQRGDIVFTLDVRLLRISTAVRQRMTANRLQLHAYWALQRCIVILLRVTDFRLRRGIDRRKRQAAARDAPIFCARHAIVN